MNADFGMGLRIQVVLLNAMRFALCAMRFSGQ